MKLKITLLPRSEQIDLPINLNTAIFKVLNGLLRTGAARSTFLSGKKDAPFTFSQLHIPERRIVENRIQAKRQELTLYLSSPDSHIVTSLMQSFVEKGEIQLVNEVLEVLKAEEMEHPEETGSLHVSCLSPFVVRRPSDHGGLQFALPHDHELQRLLSAVMRRRFRDFYGRETTGSGEFRTWFDPDYVLRRKGKITKLITAQLEDGKRPLKIKGIQAPLILEGDPELLKFTLEAGLGHYTIYGFGMLQPYSS